jgi:hypothetical protein
MSETCDKIVNSESPRGKICKLLLLAKLNIGCAEISIKVLGVGGMFNNRVLTLLLSQLLL